MKKSFKSTAVWMLAIVCLAGIAFGQTTTSIVEGRVTDASGAVLPGVTVAVEGANESHTVMTDVNGHYRAVAIPAGTYRVTASLTGFQTKVIRGIVVVLDRTVDVNITLAPGVSESVTVTGAAPMIDVTTASTKQVIDSKTIDTMPLNGRNYLDLIKLTPGVAVNTSAQASDAPTRLDTTGSIMGERAGNISYLVNGVSNNDNFRGGVLQPLTQDVVQEFEVISAGYKAEFGGGSGGVVNIITKSGTDTLQGSAFGFYRNNSLDSSNVSGQAAPTLKRYDYGVTLGGPVVRDKSWFFGSIEDVQERRGAIFPSGVPAVLAQNEDFNVVPQTRDFRGFGKYDQQLSAQNHLTVSANWTRDQLQNDLASSLSLPSNSNNSVSKTLIAAGQLTTMFSPQMFLDSSYDLRRQDFSQNQNSSAPHDFDLLLVDTGASFSVGQPPGSVQTYNQRYYTGRETLNIYPNDRHSIKTGIDYTHTNVNGVQGADLEYVIATTTASFDRFGFQSFQIPQGYAFLNPGDDQVRLRNNGISAFAQDDWKVTQNVLVNAGLRYERDSEFASNNVAPRLGVTWTPDSKTAVQASFGRFYDRYRLGLAQAVPDFGGFNGANIVETDYPRLANDALALGGTLGAVAKALKDPNFLNTKFGIPPGTLVTSSNIQSLTGMTPAQFVSAVNAYLATTGVRAVPVDFSPITGFLRENLAAAFLDEIQVARPFKTPYNDTITLGVQRQITNDFSAGVNFVHRRIHDILGLKITNLAFDSRTEGGLITTDGGPAKRVYGPWYSGKYDAAILTVQRRFGTHYGVQANYTYARSKDNLLNSNLAMGIGEQGGASVPTDNLNLNFDYGNSDLFVPQSFVLSGFADLPAGFRLSAIYQWTSGSYFSAVGSPIDYDGDGISSLRPPGTSRNQFLGPSTNNVDMRLEKRFPLGGVTASALVEGFNLTNARNPALVNNSYVNGAPAPGFGTVRVPLPGREIQLGMRLQY